jgi:hypothetical protein
MPKPSNPSGAGFPVVSLSRVTDSFMTKPVCRKKDRRGNNNIEGERFSLSTRQD